MASEQDSQDEKQTFKAPLMVGKVNGKKTTIKQLPPPDNTSSSVKPKAPSQPYKVDEKQTIPKLFPPQKCPYDEPSWAGIPEADYQLSVVRSGSIVGTEKLNKSCCLVGRHQDCDIILEHPSISRFHAVLQFRKAQNATSESAGNLGGFYLYDLGSTHGTQLNKEPVDVKSYRRVKVGHQIKFGFSSRVFILEGPSDDEEPESEFTVTEIIQQRKERALARKKTVEERAREASPEEKTNDAEDAGITWGMADDAEEEEEENISGGNPFSLNSVTNEELYLDDPKKTLRGWFEREGYELEYKVEDKGSGQFVCRVELPIDTGTGRSVIAEADVKGKKKEAVVQCALEACRILDRYGELRKAHHEGRKRKTKNWKEDEYYDSGEDEFLDRTGDLEQKRKQRKARLEKTQTVETYDTLKEKIEKLDTRISVIQRELERSKAAEAQKKESDGDCLDAFMKQLKSGTALDKAKRSQLRSELSKLLVERQHFLKLAIIANPVKLPPLEIALLPKKAVDTSSKALMTGAMRRRKRPVLPLVGIPAKVVRMQEANVDDGSKESADEDNETDPQAPFLATASKEETANSSSETPAADDGEKFKETKEPVFTALDKERAPIKFIQNKRTIGPTLPPGVLPKKEHSAGSKERAKQLTPFRPTTIQPTLNAATTSAIIHSEDADFDEWLPPKGQTGDGKTALNEKYGY